MELKINTYEPGEITFNYDELKCEIRAKADEYACVVYSEDQIKAAKADRAKLNAFKKALNDKRIALQREYLEPFNNFKAQIDDLIEIIGEPILTIDTQIKGFEEEKKEKRRQEIASLFERYNQYDWLKLSAIYDSKWENASKKLTDVENEIQVAMQKIEADLFAIGKMDFAFEATEEYKRTLDAYKAIAEGERLLQMQKRKAEMEAEKARLAAEEKTAAEGTEEPEPDFMPIPQTEEFQNDVPRGTTETESAQVVTMWLNFAVKVTTEQAKKLRSFFDENGIEFKRI